MSNNENIEHTITVGCNPTCRIAEACEIFNEIGIGRTVEAVALDALCFETPRNRQQMDSAGKDGAIRHITGTEA